MFELSSDFICTLAVGLLYNDCLYCVWLSVNILYVLGSVWYLVMFLLILFHLCFSCIVTMLNATILLNSKQK